MKRNRRKLMEPEVNYRHPTPRAPIAYLYIDKRRYQLGNFNALAFFIVKK